MAQQHEAGGIERRMMINLDEAFAAPYEPVFGWAAECDSEPGAAAARRPELSQMCRLGYLPPGTPLNERDVASIFQCSLKTIARAIRDGRLPPPVRLFHGNVWTAGSLIRHLEGLLADAAKEQGRKRRTIERLRPDSL